MTSVAEEPSCRISEKHSLFPTGRRRQVAFGRTLTGWEDGLAEFVRSLAVLVAGGSSPAGGALPARGAELLAPVDVFPPELRRTVVRLPHCFRSFDQRPEDMRRMVDAFAARRP